MHVNLFLGLYLLGRIYSYFVPFRIRSVRLIPVMVKIFDMRLRDQITDLNA